MGKYRKKIGGRQYTNYTEEQLRKAVLERLNGKSLRYVSKKYGIPKSTIDNKAKGKHTSNIGGQQILLKEEEERISNNIMKASEWGFPLTAFDIRLIVQSYLNHRGLKVQKFKDNLPGKDWIKGFLARHRNVFSQRFCQNMKRSRASLTPEIITEYFEELRETTKDVPPEGIVNYDESNLTDDPGVKKIICRRGSKHPVRILDSSKQSYSVMFAGTAAGDWLPPYIVYKAEHLYESWTTLGPKGARYNRSKSGWFTTELFEDWFFKIALPYFKTLPTETPKVLIGDNLASHLSSNVISSCVENNIRFCLLPANSTHITQPLDVACFRSLKSKWKNVLSEWKSKNRGTIPKDCFPRLLKKCLDNMKEGGKGKENLVAGFKASRILPHNPEEVLKHIPRIDTSENNDDIDKNSSIDLTFETFLKDLHDKEASPKSRQRRVNRNVTAGRSVPNLHEEQPGPSKPNKSKSVTESNEKNESVIETDKDNESEDADDVDSNDDSVSVSTEDDLKDIDYEKLSVDDFLIVQLNYESSGRKTTQKNFICKILKKTSPSSIECSFMRKSAKAANIYVFPDEPDTDTIKFEQIISVIKPLFVRRGRHSFPYEL